MRIRFVGGHWHNAIVDVVDPPPPFVYVTVFQASSTDRLEYKLTKCISDDGVIFREYHCDNPADSFNDGLDPIARKFGCTTRAAACMARLTAVIRRQAG